MAVEDKDANALDALIAAVDNVQIRPENEVERTIYEDELPIEMPSPKAYYVVVCGRKTGVFTNWLEASQLVTGYKNNAHERYKSWSDARKRWKEDCLAGTVEGRLSDRSIIGKVVERPKPVDGPTTPQEHPPASRPASIKSEV